MLDPRCDLTHNSLKSVKKNYCLENVIEFWIVNVYMFEHLVLMLQGELRWSKSIYRVTTEPESNPSPSQQTESLVSGIAPQLRTKMASRWRVVS